MASDKMNSTVKFRKAEQMFGESDIWLHVHDRDRRELYEDVLHQLAKTEKVRHDSNKGITWVTILLRNANDHILESLKNKMSVVSC